MENEMDWMENEENSWSTDYKGRCGNCHKHLHENDQYCRYCGTKRGEGKFEPYKNILRIETVYGPPSKTKHTCLECGHQWITYAVGGDKNRFCSICGTAIDRRNSQTITISPGDIVGFIVEKEQNNQIALFTEDEATRIINVKNKLCELYQLDREDEDNIPLTQWFDSINPSLIAAGFTEFQRFNEWHILTEREAERINLARYIVLAKGRNPQAYGDIFCTICSSNYVCALDYGVDVGIGDSIDIIEDEHIPGPGDELHCGVFVDNYVNVMNPDRRAKEKVAFRCLQCGHEFGNFVELYNQHKNRK